MTSKTQGTEWKYLWTTICRFQKIVVWKRKYQEIVYSCHKLGIGSRVSANFISRDVVVLGLNEYGEKGSTSEGTLNR